MKLRINHYHDQRQQKNQILIVSNGKFFMCEKMLDYEDIGNIYNGLNHSKIFEIIHQYCGFCNEDCTSCWCMHFCRACYTNAKEGKELKLIKRRSYCNKNRKETKNTILAYLDILEENPKAFEYIEKESQVDYFRDRLSFLKEKKGIKQENP